MIIGIARKGCQELGACLVIRLKKVEQVHNIILSRRHAIPFFVNKISFLLLNIQRTWRRKRSNAFLSTLLLVSKSRNVWTRSANDP